VFVASVAGKIGVPEESAYAATQVRPGRLAEALSIELEDDGVHVLTGVSGDDQYAVLRREALQRMPPVSKRTMIEPQRVVEAIVDALARGRHEITVRASLPPATSSRALAPRFMRRSTKTLDVGRLAQAVAALTGANRPAWSGALTALGRTPISTATPCREEAPSHSRYCD